jgi:hypothetical protein
MEMIRAAIASSQDTPLLANDGGALSQEPRLR